MSDNEKKVELPKPPLFTSDYIAMAEILQFAMERFGQLVLALMYYTTDGTMPDNLPPDISMMFAIYQRKIDAAREKYEQKCLNNAKNGAKGGKAKAAKASGEAGTRKFTPPTLKQFRDAVAHFYDDDELGNDEPEDYDIDRLYDELKAAGWKISGEPIQNRRDWELVIINRFSPYKGDSPIKQSELFKFTFGNFPDLRDPSGNSLADDAIGDFDEQYDKGKEGWTIAGEFYPKAKWQEALDKYIPLWQERESSE
ncbi:DUF6291 domain-containing protein [Acutalibacter muris]|uniref:DUF6291 domain-containing protein n=1 Tax=Acutalibacter muris TaxID=1796620 RepID=UPI001C3F07C4|nr:DUF6291 domain-containing protein [Acutalibacter muris]